MKLRGMSIDEAKAIIISYARNNIIANTRVGIAFATALRELDKIESRPKGKRIVLKDGIYACSLEGIDVPITVYECSNCGWVDSFEYEEDSNFCPYCGADLRSEE